LVVYLLKYFIYHTKILREEIIYIGKILN